MWFKKGLILSGHHAQLPTVFDFRGKIICLYSTRSPDNKSIIMSVELKDNFFACFNTQLALNLGERGCFDCDGVMPSSVVVKNDDEIWLYYTGWYKGDNSYTHSIGVAISNDGFNYTRKFNYPIISRSFEIPYLVNSPCVKGNKMILGVGTGWINKTPLYSLKQASSLDGITWRLSKEFILYEKNGAFSRCDFRDSDIYYAYFAYPNKYRIYKNKEIIIDVTPNSWDSEMTSYPFLYKNYIFYNGNGYGKTGIGMAEEKI